MANNVIEIKITASNAQAIAALQQVANAAAQSAAKTKAAGVNSAEGFKTFGNEAKNAEQKTKQSGEGILTTFSKISMAAYGIIGTLNLVKDAMGKVFGTGVVYDKQMETAQLGVAGILLSMTKLNGEQLKLNQAMEISNQVVKQIQDNATRIGLNPAEMVSGFQSIIGPGLQAKMTLEEIVQLTTTGTKAVKLMMGSVANEMQITQELRSMISGNIDQNSQVSKALGITSADVEQAKQTAGGLFTYLMDKMNGFKALETEWPKTLTGIIEKFKAMYSQASGNSSEGIFNGLKTELKNITDMLFVVDEKTKKVTFNPELLAVLTKVTTGIGEWISSTVQFATTLSKIVSGPASGLASILKIIFSNVQQIYLTIIAWFAIEKLRSVFATISTQLQYQLSIFRMLVATSGTFQATLFATGAVIKTLLVTTGWGALAVAIGYAADQAFKLYENLTNAGKAKRDYFKEKEDSMRPIPQQLEGKLQAPQFNTNSDVNMGGMDQNSITKLEKFISAVNYMFPDKGVTVTSGYREWGGHVSGTKADIAIDGMDDPMFRQQLISLAKEFGIAVLDEVTGPASDSPEARANWGPHLDLDMGGADGGVNAKDLQLKDQQQETEALANAKIALANAIADGKLQEYIAELKNQEQALENRNTKTNTGTATPDEKISIEEYNSQKKVIATAMANAEIEKLQQEIANESSKLSNKNYTNADKTTIQKNIETLQSQIRQKQIDLQTTIEGLDNAQNTALQALKDEALEVQITNLENKGQYSDAQKLRSEKQYRAKKQQFDANNMPDASAQLQENVLNDKIQADYNQAEKTVENAVKLLSIKQEKLIQGVARGAVSVNDALSQYQTEFDAKTSKDVATLKSDLESAKTSGLTETVNKIELKLKEIADQSKEFVEKLLKALDNSLQKKIQDIESNPDLTSMQKESQVAEVKRTDAADRVTYIKNLMASLESKDKDSSYLKPLLEDAQTLSERLNKLVDINYQVSHSFKESFESGLLTFLTDGVTKCETLAEAFKNFASSVVSSIQRVYAEAITKDIMSAFKLGDYNNKPGTDTGTQAGETLAQQQAAIATSNNTLTLTTLDTTIWTLISTLQTISLTGSTSSSSSGISSSNLSSITDGLNLDGLFADGGSMDSGEVKGPGTGTSDSILAYLGNFKKFVGISNGEYMIKSAAVKKFGTRFFESLNNGLIPSSFLRVKAMFADGGSMSGKILDGPQALAASLSSGDTNVHLRNINLFDMDEIGNYIQGRKGERVVLNLMKNNASTVSQLLKFRG